VPAFPTTVSDRWNIIGGVPNGGYLLALCVRALAATLPHPDPLVVAASFLRPGAPGPADVQTELVRRGRRIATGEARLVQDGKEVVRALGSFADLAAANGRTVVLGEPPRLPPPDECETLDTSASPPEISIVNRYEYRFAEPPGWTRGQPSGDPRHEFWLRFSDGRPVDALTLPLVVDAAAPAVLELGEAGSSTVELTVHLRGRPEPGWLACRMSTRHLIDGFHEEDFEVWDETGRLVAQSRQLALLS
jgi:acyl-CoA thioesterase